MTLQWVAADMRTGRIIADLPSLEPQWPLRRTISTASTVTATLHLDDETNPEWPHATQPCGAIIACYDDSDPDLPIQWGGYVQSRNSDAGNDDVDLQISTLEAYADERFVDDRTYTTGQHRDDIIADLAAILIDGAEPGIPLQLDYTPGAGDALTADLVMQNTDNATVLTRWQQIFGQLGGGEFTIDLTWSADRESLVPVLRFGDKLGAVTAPGLDPAVTFEMPGVLTNFTRLEQFGSGKGANKIVAYSTGQGAVSPYAPAVLAPDFAGRPTFEYRYQPAPSTDIPALTPYAAQAVKILAPGANPVVLHVSTARLEGRRLGKDWQLGDEIGYRVASQDANGAPIRAFPDGAQGTGRSIGYELTDTTVTPILADKTIYTES